MRLVAEMIRGEKVEMALHMLEHSPQQAAGPVEEITALRHCQLAGEK